MQLDKKLSCPHCSKKLDSIQATDGTDIAPSEGDYSICLYCEGIVQYKITKFITARLQDIKDLELRYELIKARDLIQRYKKECPRMH